MQDIISEIWSTAQRNKLRTALTGFAVAWGIFMLIVLLGAGNGLINANEQQANRFLANSMRVYEGVQRTEGRALGSLARQGSENDETKVLSECR